MERLEALDIREPRPMFCFQSLPVTGNEHLVVAQLAVGYQYPVLKGIGLSILGGQKVVLTGFNGIGKSTLLKTLVGKLPALDGTIHFSDQVVFAYFEQNLSWQHPEWTTLEIISDAFPRMSLKDCRKHLAQCGFRSEHVQQAVNTLSGGEQAKLKLCLLTLTPCNFLILDEPTNHLDHMAKEALQEALVRFPGTVLLVSHEKRFYQDWVDKVINIER